MIGVGVGRKPQRAIVTGLGQVVGAQQLRPLGFTCVLRGPTFTIRTRHRCEEGGGNKAKQPFPVLSCAVGKVEPFNRGYDFSCKRTEAHLLIMVTTNLCSEFAVCKSLS